MKLKMFSLPNQNLSSKIYIVIGTFNSILFSLVTKKLDNNQIEGRFGDGAKFILTAKPFRLDLFINDIFVISVNSKNMFNFEHYRKRPEYDDKFLRKKNLCYFQSHLELREQQLKTM